jgi:hypothetical protein
VAGSKQHPIAVRECTERHGGSGPGQGICVRDDDDELLPSQLDDGSAPLCGLRPHGDIGHAHPHGLSERVAVGVFVQRDGASGVVLMPGLECRRQDSERD